MAEQEPIRAADDVDVRRVAWTAALIVGAVAFALAAAWLALHFLEPVPGATAAPSRGAMAIVAPVLETAPQPERVAYDAEKARLITTYGWVDRKAGIARIPVEEAMRILAAQAKKESQR